MNDPSSLNQDPFQTLGLSSDEADEEAIRKRYLALVKQFPPETAPARFREISAAYQAVKDPLVLAQRLLIPPDPNAPSWTDVLERQKAKRPPLGVNFLLSLGNRAEEDSQSERKPSENKHDG